MTESASFPGGGKRTDTPPELLPAQLGPERGAVEDQRGAALLALRQNSATRRSTSDRPSPASAGPPQDPRRLLPSIR